MSDFQEADINELLTEKGKDKGSEDERAYRALLEQDHKMLSGFRKVRPRMHWPEPVRKRHIR